MRSWVQVLDRVDTCHLASSRWEPALLGRPSPSEVTLGSKPISFVLASVNVLSINPFGVLLAWRSVSPALD